MKVFFTGATGFIGGEVVKRLLAQGDTVRVLVRPETLARSDRGREVQRRAGVEVISGDLTDANAVRMADEGVEVVYHLAWQFAWKWKGSDFAGRRPDAEDLARINLEMTQNLLKACAERRISRLVYTSTAAVYGSRPSINKWPVTEETPFQKGSYGDFSRSYIAPKIAIENLIRRAAKESGFEYVILRPSIVYGVGSPFADCLLNQAFHGVRQVQRLGSKRLWPLLHVRDVADAVVRAGSCREAARREFNIARDEVATFNEMVQMLRAAAFRIDRGLPLPGRFLGGWRGAPPYDTTKAQMFLSFRPCISLAEGLVEIMAAARGMSYTAVRSGDHGAALSQVYKRWFRQPPARRF